MLIRPIVVFALRVKYFQLIFGRNWFGIRQGSPPAFGIYICDTALIKCIFSSAISVVVANCHAVSVTFITALCEVKAHGPATFLETMAIEHAVTEVEPIVTRLIGRLKGTERIDTSPGGKRLTLCEIIRQLIAVF